MTNEIINTGEGGLTPGDVKGLMRLAIEKGDKDAALTLEKLVGLAERVEDRQAKAAFDAAYFAFRDECPTIERTRQGKVAVREGTPFSWWYAPYEKIRATVDPILHRNGLSIRESSEESEGVIRAIVEIRHVRGHSERSTFTARKGGANTKMSAGQQDAGTLTLALRRALAMALGIVTSDPEEPRDEEEGGVVTEAQARQIEEMLISLDASADFRAKFKERFHVKEIASMPAAVWPIAMDDLKKIAEKKGVRS